MESNLPTINSVEFWARETMMPLFWLTDSEHDLGKSGLFFYKNGMFHFYYLNGSEKHHEEAGYAFFSNKENVSLYEKETRQIVEEIANLFKEYDKLDLEKLNNEELTQSFYFLRGMMNRFSGLYLKSEESRMRRLIPKETDLIKIAEIRLELRKSLPILFGVVIDKFLNEVALRNELSVQKDLFFHSFDEMLGLFNNGNKLEDRELASRREGFAVLREGERSTLFLDKDALILWHKVNDILLPKDKKEIKGSPVYGGVVRGRAKILFQSQDEAVVRNGYGVKNGDIIVTDMTKPDMMIACKNASGIITDEGGVVCHASIIAREFKKPCIVGTKFATQVIKNGDLLELDADNGIVRVLNKM